MDGLVLGIDLCDAYASITAAEPERTWTVRTAVCKNRQTDEWYVGEEASVRAMAGDPSADRLLTRLMKDEKTEMGGQEFSGLELLKRFLKEIVEIPRKAMEEEQISQLVITLRKTEVKLMDSLLYCADYLEIPRSCFLILSTSCDADTSLLCIYSNIP